MDTRVFIVLSEYTLEKTMPQLALSLWNTLNNIIDDSSRTLVFIFAGLISVQATAVNTILMSIV